MSHRVHQSDCWPLFEVCVSLLPGGRTRLHISIDMLIADGRSFEIIFTELAELYKHGDARFDSLKFSFRDYQIAAASIEETELFNTSRRYWLQRLPSLPPAPELPLAKNPASVVQPRFCRHTQTLAGERWRKLKRYAASLGFTPSGVLLAACAEVLTIWSKSPRFTLNLTLFNRLPVHQQVDHIVGDFTAVNLLEVDNSRPDSFCDRTRRVKDQLWRDLDHRYFSGVRVMREIARSQELGLKAIMPVVFSSFLGLSDAEQEQIWAAKLGEPVYAISQTPQVYLDFMMHETRHGLVLNWDAVDELFPEGLLDDMLSAYVSLLSALAEDESAWQRTVAANTEKLVPNAQMVTRKQANDTKRELSTDLLHTGFLRQVENRPEAVAVSTPGKKLTYRQLHAHAAAVEHHLLDRGIRTNRIVAVIMEKGWEQVAAVLGIHFAGAAYLPIDPDLPAERQEYLLRNGEAGLVLTQSAVQNRISVPPDIEMITVDKLAPLTTAPAAMRERQRPEDVAYIIYTSGSTGTPKGVVIDHRGAVNTVLDINQRFTIGPSDRVLALSRLNFDLSVYDIFGLLAAGGTIVMPSADLANDPAHWTQLINSEKVTIWNTVPALMQLLVEEAGNGTRLADCLRLVMMSGDWIPVTLPAQVRRLHPQAQITSLGGATEASIWSILYPIEHVEPTWKSIPYGKPMWNQTFQVLNQAMAPCPVWVPGQLYIGGIGLAKGYWRDPQKTNASFIRHPRTGEPLYRTGDWGRYLPDGNIEFLGREDTQVKVQGYRIELGEIEFALQQHPAVENCIVIARNGSRGEKRLVGYVIPKAGTKGNAEELKQHLRRKISEYMVPSAFVFLDALPLTANGKVNREALPEPAGTTGCPRALQTPRDQIDLRLIALWQKILGVRRVALDDNFFDLGGNSLRALRLFSEIAKQTRKMLPLSTLLQAPTVAALADVIRADGWRPRWSTLVPIQQSGTKPPFFCVHGGAGNVLVFRELARHLGPDYPLYGLQALGVDGSRQYLRTVQAMALHYLREIREVHPHGPYYLGGFCMGGLVAYEIAQQLQAAGDEVGLLVLIDTYNYRGVPLHPSFRQKIVMKSEKVIFHALNMRGLNWRDKRGYLRDKCKGALDRELEKLTVMFSRFTGNSADGNVRQFVEAVNDEANFSYTPGPYDGPVTLFKPKATYGHLCDPQYSWGHLVERLAITQLPAYPGGLFISPYVETLANHLKERIDQATTNTASHQHTTSAPAARHAPSGPISDAVMREASPST